MAHGYYNSSTWEAEARETYKANLGYIVRPVKQNNKPPKIVKKEKQGMMAHICNFSPCEAEAEAEEFQPGLHIIIKKKKKRRRGEKEEEGGRRRR